jgi:DNA-directed RNA polymerase subunit M/transcription elongation factor TFIIS
MPAHGLLLTQKADIKSVKLPDTLTPEAIQTLLKRKDVPEMLTPYAFKDLTLFVFASTDGKAGTENKHELPPPHDSILLFGDVLIVASKDKDSFSKPVTFKAEDYEAFYTRAFGGFDETEEGDEEEEEEEAEVDADAEAEAEVEAEDEPEEEIVKPRRKGKVLVTPTTYSSFVSVHPSAELKEGASEMHSYRTAILATVTEMFKDILTPGECQELEMCIYNGSIREAQKRHVALAWAHQPFVRLYQMYARRISTNFHPDSYVNNKELFQRYKKGEITLDDMSRMNSYDLFETRWKDSFEQQQIREKRQLEGDKSMATDQFLCGRCHKRECTYYEMQTRAADEPMTIFISCLNCGKHWRQ